MADEKNTINVNGREYQKDSLPGELTFTLRKPITIGDQVYDTLELCEPNGDQLEKFEVASRTSPVGAMMLLISMVSTVALPIIKKVGTRDINEMTEYLSVFMNGAQPTQNNLSPD